ncbi:MAG: ATP-binding protein, partial [Nannocystaceae bacterium]
VTDVIPELELIIGQPEAAAALPAPEAANRFRSTFRNLVRAFASEEHPLVIFLDDLQWSDIASLKLIELLLTDEETNHVLWIGAYREAELGPEHILHITLRNLRDADVSLEGIGILPLEPEHTTKLVVDTLFPALPDAERLAALIQAKTDGNPFFVRVLLRSLNEQGLLRFDSARGGWNWDIAKVEEARLSDDVVELMASKIERLGAKTREALKYAACIGNRFDLKLLATVAGRTPLAVAEDLWEAVERGIIRPIGDGYKYLSRTSDASDISALALDDDVDVHYQFVHDKVQLAAYKVLGESERREVHLRIGRLLLIHRTEAEVRESVFSVINHLNTGIVLIDDPAERQRLASLNLVAGRRATQSIAYDSAVNYLRQGLALLPAHAWSSCYEVNFQLNRELMKAEYLAGNVNGALELYQPLLDHARTTLEKGDVYVAKVELDASLKHNEEAVKSAQDGLKTLGMSVPSSATVPAILTELARFEWKLRKLRISDIPRLPELKDPTTRVGLTLMISAVPAAYFVDTRFAAVLMLRIANITLSEGLTDVSPFGFAGYGLVLSGQLNSHEKAYEFAELAHKLNERFRNPWLDTKLAFMTALFIRVWVRPFEEVRRQLDEAYHTGLQKGDLNYALYSGVKSVTVSLLEGLNLSRVIDMTTTLLPPVSKMGEHDGEGMLTVLRRTCLCLRGDFPEPPSFGDPDWDEAAFAGYLADERVPTPQAYFYYNLFKSMVLYMFGDHDEAARHLAVVEMRLESTMAQPVLADFYFYQCLNAAALYHDSPRDRRRHDKAIKASLKRLEKWAKLCPANFEPRYLLAAAEKSRLEGHPGDTLIFYNRAIESARRYGALHCEAISYERTARVCLGSAQSVVGESYLRESRSAYRRWGASAKSNLLSAEFPDVLPDESLTGEMLLDPDSLSPRITQASSAKVLDIDT